MKLPTFGLLNIVIIIQRNKTKYLINWLQIEYFAYINNQNIFIFPIKYYWLKKDGRSFVQNKLFFDTQDRKCNCIGPDLFFYCKKILVNLLINQYTSLRIVNCIGVIVNGVVLNSEGELKSVTL